MNKAERDLCKRRAKGLELQKRSNCSWCLRCFTPWDHCQFHHTMVGDRDGIFALCEDCWQACSIEERMVHYRTLYEWWVEMDPKSVGITWRSIEIAVLTERQEISRK